MDKTPNKKILKVLDEFGKSQDDLYHIYQILLATGVGIRNTEKIVSEEKLLRKFFQLKETGLSDSDAGMKMAMELYGF